MYIGTLCKRDFATVDLHHSVVEAAKRMRAHHVGDIVVVDGGAPVGVLTDKDILVGILTKKRASVPSLRVDEVMGKGVLVAREDDELTSVLERMQKSRTRCIPVVDDRGRVSGVFTLDDLVDRLSIDVAGLAAMVAPHTHGA